MSSRAVFSPVIQVTFLEDDRTGKEKSLTGRAIPGHSGRKKSLPAAHQSREPPSLQERASPALSAPASAERHDLLPECGDVTVHNPPDLIGIHAEVCINQDVPKTDHLFPRNAGRSASQTRGKTCGCLTDDLEVVDHPDLHQFIPHERLAASNGIPLISSIASRISRSRSFPSLRAEPSPQGSSAGTAP